MKLHAHNDHLDYHPIAPYVEVTIDCGRTELNRVVSFCTASGEYECYADPLRVNAEGELEMIKEQSNSLTFEISTEAPTDLVNSWYDRELRKYCMSHITKLKELK